MYGSDQFGEFVAALGESAKLLPRFLNRPDPSRSANDGASCKYDFGEAHGAKVKNSRTNAMNKSVTPIPKKIVAARSMSKLLSVEPLASLVELHFGNQCLSHAPAHAFREIHDAQDNVSSFFLRAAKIRDFFADWVAMFQRI